LHFLEMTALAHITAQKRSLRAIQMVFTPQIKLVASQISCRAPQRRPSPPRAFACFASSANPPEENQDPSIASSNASPGQTPPPTTTTGNAIAVPAGLRTAGAVFVLAGFLKLLILCFPYSSMAISMYLQGRADLGTWAVLKMLPFALGVLALARALVDRGLHQRKWFSRAVVFGAVVALLLSRWMFARPRASPLDPLVQEYNQQQQATVAALRAERQRQQQGAGNGRALQPSDDARQEMMQRSQGGRGSRFSPPSN
jgi:hypothetical protein